MVYKTLASLFYSDKLLHEQTYKARFEAENAVKLNFSVAGNEAFFTPEMRVMQLSYQIAKADKEVALLSDELPGIAKEQYTQKCLIDEIVITNRIEGVHSSRKEIGEALEVLEKQAEEKGKRVRFVGLVNKYYKLIEQEEVPLSSCADVRRLYDELVLAEVVEEEADHAPDGVVFRKERTAVHSAAGKVIHEGLYPESEIIAAMENALAFLNNDTVEELWRVCIFHYLIEYIHPFYDGNGRLGRFILSYCLSKTLTPLVAYRLSETIKNETDKYYDAFKICNVQHNKADLTPFLIMMLEMILTALGELKEALRQKKQVLEKYVCAIGKLVVEDDREVAVLYDYLIQAALFSETGISTEMLMELFGKSYYMVRKLLDSIEPELLESKRKGKSKYYQLNLAALDKRMTEDMN